MVCLVGAGQEKDVGGKLKEAGAAFCRLSEYMIAVRYCNKSTKLGDAGADRADPIGPVVTGQVCALWVVQFEK